MFVGAVSYFRNPAAHFRRTSEDVLETMEELIFASRLLRLVAGRRSAAKSRSRAAGWTTTNHDHWIATREEFAAAYLGST
jgi:hypothetical protein